MKNYFKIFLFILFTLIFSSAVYGGTDKIKDTDLYCELEGGKVYYNKSGVITGAETSVVLRDVPMEIDGTVITCIGPFAFNNCDLVSELAMPETLEKISVAAFANCTQLKKIIIPATVNTIEAQAFFNTPKNMVIFCEPGSYTDDYAKQSHISRTYTGETILLDDDTEKQPVKLNGGNDNNSESSDKSNNTSLFVVLGVGIVAVIVFIVSIVTIGVKKESLRK